MVDVTAKQLTFRRAEARARVCGVGDLSRIAGGADRVLLTARAAGLLGGKQTSSLIPLCHPLPLSSLEVELVAIGDDVEISAIASTFGQTGVEMEALTACALASLSVVSSVSPASNEVRVEDLALWEKSGGRSGRWSRELDAAASTARSE
jgi:cyclic pyranopterin phosphate synthase